MEFLGFIGAALMGLSLGLIGGGGSILTVPILVYLFSINPVTATAYSLFVVGTTSLVGSVSHLRMGNIHWRAALVFGVPSIISIFITRSFIVPAIPDVLVQTSTRTLTKPLAILLFFALIMLIAAYTMITNKKAETESTSKETLNYPVVFFIGIGVGMIAGLVGAGGGFLIIPTLVLLVQLPMKRAIGTSLAIIASNSLIGFMGDLHGNMEIDWKFLLLFSVIAIIGITVGSLLSRKISGEKLKHVFGWFVLAMGLYIIIKETIINT